MALGEETFVQVKPSAEWKIPPDSPSSSAMSMLAASHPPLGIDQTARNSLPWVPIVGPGPGHGYELCQWLPSDVIQAIGELGQSGPPPVPPLLVAQGACE